VRYGQIEALRQDYPAAALCRLLGVSESGYHAWRKRPPSARARQEARLEMEIRAAHQRTRETCGPERLQAELSDHGVRVGIHRIKRIRKKLGLRCRQKRKFKATTDSKHALPVAPNLLERQFTVEAPNRAWVTDITYIATDEGWLYLAGVKDLFSGEVVGYAMSERMTKSLVMKALFRACATKRPGKGLIHHSDSQRIEASSRTSGSRKRWTVWYVGAAGCPVWFDPHSDRLDVSFPGPVDLPEHPAVRLRLADACDPRRA
jgi:putative transposase